MPRVHSLALRLVRVAQGQFDGAIAGGNAHDWDLAAADLLVHEAGGLVTTLDGKALTYKSAGADPQHPGCRGARSAAALAELMRTTRTSRHNSALSGWKA
jgi:myo-inositol-1(or 4)-monophosphatase